MIYYCQKLHGLSMPFEIGQKADWHSWKACILQSLVQPLTWKQVSCANVKMDIFSHQTRKLNVSLTTDYTGFVTEEEFVNTSRGPKPKPPTYNVTFFGFFVFCNTSKVWNNKHTFSCQMSKHGLSLWVWLSAIKLVILWIWLPAGISALWHATVGSLDIVWIKVTTNTL